MRLCLDTNVAIRLIRGDKAIRQRASQLEEILIPAPVAGELLYGAAHSQRREENWERHSAFIDRHPALWIGRRTVERYGQIRAALRRKCRPIPDNDVWIGALCLEHGVGLATTDPHFREVEGLVVEIW